jgi:hypothetical protein
VRVGEVDHSLQAAAHVVGQVHIAGDSRYNRVYQQQAHAADGVDRAAQVCNVL